MERQPFAHTEWSEEQLRERQAHLLDLSKITVNPDSARYQELGLELSTICFELMMRNGESNETSN